MVIRKRLAWAKPWDKCPTAATLVQWEGPMIVKVATPAGHSPTAGLLHPVRWSAKVVHAKCSSTRHRCVLEAAFCLGEARG